MKSLFPEKVHTYIYIFALSILVIGMPLSKFLMSLSQIILACNWILEGDLKNKVIRFFKNKAAIFLSSFLILHFLGIIYSEDLSYAINDIKIKIPLFVLPLIISTSKPLNNKTFHFVLSIFIASTFLATIISMFVLLGYSKREVVDIRDISIFISHIRFSLLICVSIFITYFTFKKTTSSFLKISSILLIFWFIVFLIILESVTGIAILLATTTVLMLAYFFRKKTFLQKATGFTLIFAGILVSSIVLYTVFISSSKNNVPATKTVLNETKLGNKYTHDTTSNLTENGNYIWINICYEELEEVWPKRSRLQMSGNDLKGNPLHFTMIRFLASKNLTKDATGLNSLTDEEIRAIERGVANVNNMNISSFTGRIRETIWEMQVYHQTGDANGHSLAQRFEYWKAALGIISKNALLGVGTGDLEIALYKQYADMNFKLLPQYQLHPHNQFLSVAVCFGLVGLFWFLLSLFYPLLTLNIYSNLLYLAFFTIAIISFLTEDTLETQAGVTFFAFLNSFLLFAKEKESSYSQ